jgi:MoxR-like ATPase
MEQSIKAINEMVKEESRIVEKLTAEMQTVIVGQKNLIERLLIGLLTQGHILLEGVPGLAKTLSVKVLSQSIDTKFQRLQFTPDLLPADLIGTMVFNQKEGNFIPKKGPIFANIILADEINRAPAKVQSALLEAMQEKQVTIGEETFLLEEPFLVLATQNPIEQEGTYPLPEAQVDRFMLKVKVGYPDKTEEKEILEKMSGGKVPEVKPVVSSGDILSARETILQIYMDERIKDYIVDLVHSSRTPEEYNLDFKDLVRYGASPRASIYLTIAARVHAFLRGRGYVIPEDVKAIGHDVLRHRLILSYEAEAEEITTEDIIDKIFDTIEVP